MPRVSAPKGTFSTSGIDLSETTLDTEMEGVRSECLQANLLTAIPLSLHPIVHTLEKPSGKVGLHEWPGLSVRAHDGQRWLSEIICKISAEPSFLTPHWRERGK